MLFFILIDNSHNIGEKCVEKATYLLPLWIRKVARKLSAHLIYIVYNNRVERQVAINPVD